MKTGKFGVIMISLIDDQPRILSTDDKPHVFEHFAEAEEWVEDHPEHFLVKFSENLILVNCRNGQTIVQ